MTHSSVAPNTIVQSFSSLEWYIFSFSIRNVELRYFSAPNLTYILDKIDIRYDLSPYTSRWIRMINWRTYRTRDRRKLGTVRVLFKQSIQAIQFFIQKNSRWNRSSHSGSKYWILPKCITISPLSLCTWLVCIRYFVGEWGKCETAFICLCLMDLRLCLTVFCKSLSTFCIVREFYSQ